MKAGYVYIAGAGPGDEKLISMRAMELVQKADVIVYDRLGAKKFLAYAKKDCETINAGKQPQNHRLHQSQINDILIAKAKEGKKVLRLKGGDPFLFGRGGEECEALEQEGIPFEVVPGISSFYSVCAYGGIPVTHREYASSFHVFTGHRMEEGTLDYKTIAKLEGTLVFLMSMKHLGEITERLCQEGKIPETPAAAIQWGTTSRQKKIVGTLETIATLAEQAGIGHPAVVVIGEVVRVENTIAWQKYRKLFGKHMLLVGSGESVAEAKAMLQEEGADVTMFSAIKIVEKREQLAKALERLEEYTWIFFTSVHSVAVFFATMAEKQMDIRKLYHCNIFCIGEKTKEAVEKKGIFVDKVPKAYNSKQGAREMAEFLTKEDTILFPASELAGTVLEEQAKRLGVSMVRVTAYENHMATEGAEEIQKALRKGEFDGIGFFSSSQVNNLFELGGEDVKKCHLFAIGEATREAIEERGGSVVSTAAVSTGKGLARCMVEGMGGEG